MKNNRLHLIDSIRGITLISMILYHGCWDAVFLAGVDWKWYTGEPGFVWQQSICWTFILLSGFCVPFSHSTRSLAKRGLLVSLCGLLVTAVTLVALPEDRVVFGVLTFIGAAMLLMVPLRSIHVPAAAGLPVCAFLFLATRHINEGVLLYTLQLPRALYRGYFATFLGFQDPQFFSTDYFSLIPWFFLFLCGYFLNRILTEADVLDRPIFRTKIRPLAFLGRHSLLIYLLHQPVLYALVLVYSAFT